MRGPVVDLCCGIGGDLVALAAHGPVVGVDRDSLHAWMAHRNAQAYGVGERVTTEVGDVRAADLTRAGAVFVDPARRTERGRTRDGEPPLDWCLGLAARVPHVAVKAAPGLDRATVPAGWEVEFVAVGTDLKEAVLWAPALARAGDAGHGPVRGFRGAHPAARGGRRRARRASRGSTSSTPTRP